MNRSFLRLEHVQKRFDNEYLVLNNITATFWQGHTYAIQGASGAGKSSLMHILAGLDTPTVGTVFFNHQNLAFMVPSERHYFLQQCVGLLFQQPYVIKELTVLENVMLPAFIAGRDEQKSYEDALALLQSVDLAHKINVKPATLSGGQQQRVALARALINKPLFLLADEPTSNLDTVTAKKIIDLIVELHKIWGIGIIISTHDTYGTHAMNTRYVLKEGSLIT